MTFNIEVETDRECELDYREILEKVANAVLDMEKCPYEAEVNLLITGDEEIHEINLSEREIDRATDVLSFPFFQYETPADFAQVDDDVTCFNPDTGELMLGDIVISLDHVYEQAEKYGHTTYRELAFLIAHSMLHLIGYDHMIKEEETVMFAKQEQALNSLGIIR